MLLIVVLISKQNKLEKIGFHIKKKSIIIGNVENFKINRN